MLTINGKPKHIYGYLQDFLFTPQRARRPARFLSGGERNRLLLARIFKRPSNVMVLDEPTNDLDTETLELLEELVVNYSGTVLLVSHDRAFLNNVVTSTIVLDGNGHLKEYDGGYDDYVRQKAASHAVEVTAATTPGQPASVAEAPSSGAKKLSYKEQQELAQLPQTIENLETEQSTLHETMAASDFFKRPGPEIAGLTARLDTIGKELEAAYARWEELAERDL